MLKNNIEILNKITKSIHYKWIGIDYMFENIRKEKNIILEQYGIYIGQYNDANEISNIVIDMAIKRISEKTIEYNFSNIGQLTLKINVQIINGRSSASIKVSKNLVELFVNVSTMLIFDKNECFINDLNDNIEFCIVHELNHLKNNIERNDFSTTDWYKTCLKICNDYRPNSDVYHFAFSLYLSDYREVQAICSELPLNIINEISKIKNWKQLDKQEKKKIIFKLFYNSEQFKIYSTILEVILPEIKGYIDFQVKEIIDTFSINGYSMDVAKFNKFVQQIEFSSKRAISKMKYYLNYVFKKENLL